MSEKPKFAEFFKIPVLLSSFSGLYVPDAHKLLPMSNIFDKVFKLLTALALIFLFVIIIDVTITVAQKAYPTVVGYFFLVGIYMVLCDFLKLLYTITRRKEWSKIIRQWDLSFQQPLFTNQRHDELSKEKKFVEKIVKWEYGLLVTSAIFWGLLPPLLSRKQSVESALPWNHTKSPTFEITATYHFFYGVFMMATWSANDSWLMIYLSLVAAELRHLKLSLTSIFSHLKTFTAGKIYCNEQEITEFNHKKIEFEIYCHKMNEIQKLLKIWIDHHSELISFSLRLKNFYSPIILIHYIFFVGFNCTMLFLVATGSLPTLLIAVVVVISSVHGCALYLMCWFGDRIETQNTLIAEEAFHQDWITYPKDVAESLRLIIKQSQRPVKLGVFSIMPLNVRSFGKILKACYTFFMFIRDTNQKVFLKQDNINPTRFPCKE